MANLGTDSSDSTHATGSLAAVSTYKAVAPASGRVTQIFINANGAYASPNNIVFGIYDSDNTINSGDAGTLLAQTASQTGLPDGISAIDLLTPIDVVAGHTYWMALYQNNVFSYHSLTTSGDTRFILHAPYTGTFPSLTASGLTDAGNGVQAELFSFIGPPVLGVSATGSADSVTPQVGGTPAGASATGSPGSPAISIQVPISGVMGDGLPGYVIFGLFTVLNGVQATGTPGSVLPNVEPTPQGASAAGAVGSLGISTTTFLTGVHATGSAHSEVISETVYLKGVRAQGAGAPIFIRPPVYFGIYSIMRDSAIGVEGAISDAAVAVIGAMPPGAQFPLSLAVPVEGVEAEGFAATITPFFNITTTLAGVSAAGMPGVVGAP